MDQELVRTTRLEISWSTSGSALEYKFEVLVLYLSIFFHGTFCFYTTTIQRWTLFFLLVFVLTTTKQIEINIIKRVALYKNLFKSWFTTELNQPRSPNLSHLGYLGFHRLTRCRYSDVTEVLSCCASSTRGWANYVDPAVTQMSAVSSSSSSPAAFDRLKQNCLKPVDIIPKCPKWKCLCLVG